MELIQPIKMKNISKDDDRTNYYSVLDTIYQKYFEDFKKHSDVTSSFWQNCSNRHRVRKENGRWDISGYGLGSFISKSFRHAIRHLPTVVFSKKLIKDYDCPNKLIKAGYAVSDSSNRIFNFDCAKIVLVVNEIAKQLSVSLQAGSPFTKKGIQTACIIGDGYAYCSSLLKLVDPKLKILSINLGKSLFFDIFFSQKCLPEESVALIQDDSQKAMLFESHSLLFLAAETYYLLKELPIDLFINITSMQEMEPAVIDNYFEFMRHSSSMPVYFYCCNRIEKILPDKTVVCFHKYPWKDSIVLLDELCPWHQKYPEARFPIWRAFDGPIQHRMVQLK
ncbi:MAG: putative sugar O-methyltransferase [Desulfobacterales bacterium]|jgi:hypothetical protein|nr:putative sugar O-methyltransferase [Desulfobacterales bacterium]MDP6808197.1 putative sugar O-methyltransferase [Desulfobacterales bacterium]|tara:strand:+ start:29937 stop:30941 length:1005 start_codon:yes stop_codon:yes gene_type:complete